MDLVLAADFHADAVTAARQRTAGPSMSRSGSCCSPAMAAGHQVDLVVLSEIGYFFRASAWAELCARAGDSLADSATVVACHWRRDFAERTLPTAALHAQLGSVLGLPQHTTVTDADFVIDVWTTSPGSVAETAGLA